MFEIRYTVVDPRGTVSFVGPGHVLKMLVAACSHMPSDLAGLLGHLRTLDRQFTDQVQDALAAFDEHHVAGVAAGERPAGVTVPNQSTVFRVLDTASRQASLQPSRAGVVVFNLIERRIVQIQNTYAEIKREDRGRMRRAGRPVQTYYQYHLPSDWQIVP